MKRFLLGLTTIVVALIFTTGASTHPRAATDSSKAVTSAQDIPVKITDSTGKSMKIESLPRKAQERVTLIKRNARSLAGSDAQGFTISIECKCCPLRCNVDIIFRD